MRVGLQFCDYNLTSDPARVGPALTAVARAADAAGFHSLWDIDHFFAMEPFTGTVDEPMFEGYTVLAHLAAVTERLRLGTLVSGVVYRNPAFLVKQVTSLDVLSGGRAYFGVGAAWFEREAKGYGFPFPPLGERFEWLEETLQVALQLWSGEVKPYHGKHFHMAELLCNPMPLSRPHPPILIGGMGEKKTLRLVARYADACNLVFGDDLDTGAHKLRVLRAHCETEGRDFTDIECTCVDTIHLAPGQMSSSDVVARCRRLADIGIQHVIFNMPNALDVAPIEQLGREVIPEVAGY